MYIYMCINIYCIYIHIYIYNIYIYNIYIYIPPLNIHVFAWL